MNRRFSVLIVVSFVLVTLGLAFQNCSPGGDAANVASSGASASNVVASSTGPQSPALKESYPQLGLGEPIIENRLAGKGWDIDAQLDRILPLKPKIFRLWFPAEYLYNAQGVPIDTYLPYFKRPIERLNAAGIPILGLQHNFPAWMTNADWSVAANWNTIPCMTDSSYRSFLIAYEKHWTRMAQLFPGVQYWEPANETNGIESLKPVQVGAGSCGKIMFTHDERVMITIQLMEAAHRAIKTTAAKVGKNPTVVMPPPGPQNDELALSGPSGSNDVKLVTLSRFIADIYRAIASWRGNPRDYFDAVAWHPYTFSQPDAQTWVAANRAIYDVVVANGDAAVPILLSEAGNSDENYDATVGLKPMEPSVLASWMQDAIRLTQSEMRWVSHLIWFRAFDDESARSWGGEHQVRFGIYHVTGSNFATLSKKPSVDVFCKFTGCVSEPFRARVSAGANSGSGSGQWRAFWFNANDKAYCLYESDADFQRLLGMDLSQTMPFLPALNTDGLYYTGRCQ